MKTNRRVMARRLVLAVAVVLSAFGLWSVGVLAYRMLAGRPPYEPTLDDRRYEILLHFRTLLSQEDARFAIHKLRVFTGWYTHGLPGGRHLRVKIGALQTADAFLDEVERFFPVERLEQASLHETHPLTQLQRFGI